MILLSQVVVYGTQTIQIHIKQIIQELELFQQHKDMTLGARTTFGYHLGQKQVTTLT